MALTVLIAHETPYPPLDVAPLVKISSARVSSELSKSYVQEFKVGIFRIRLIVPLIHTLWVTLNRRSTDCFKKSSLQTYDHTS